MAQLAKTKEEIFEQTIMKNIRRKSKYVDQVQMHKGLPLFSWIDINCIELCNRKCDFCPRKSAEEYPNQNLKMTVDLARKIADELRQYDYKGGVIFSGCGEPLLHDNILELVRVFGNDIHTEFVTNGDKLTIDIIRDLFDAGLGVLLVSMYDGPHQVDFFERMFEEAGIPKERFVLRDRWYGVEEDYGVKLTNRGGTVTSGRQSKVDVKRPCFYTHYCMQLDWNGDVLVCAQDWRKKIKFGNVYAESLWDIWKSRNFDKYRRMLLNGYRTTAPCHHCNTNGTLHGKKHAEVWKAIYEKDRMAE